MSYQFRSELQTVSADLVNTTGQAADAIRSATLALLAWDHAAAARAVELRFEIVTAVRAIEDRCLELLARGQPVAGDLRAVISAFRTAGSLERMGVLAAHIAEAGERRHPEPVVPTPLVELIAGMASVAECMCIKVGSVIAHRDATAAAELHTDDDAMDELHEQLFRALLHRHPPYPMEAAVDLTLIGRYYERFADHTVAVADELHYLVAGVLPPARA